MISFDHEAIFVRVPKTAGTSISAALGCAEVGPPHRNIREVRDLAERARREDRLPAGARLAPDWFERFYKFGFVRNPWSRVVSLYRRREGNRMAERLSFEEFVGWIGFASDTCIHPTRHRNQLDWFTDGDGTVLVDHIGKFETIEADWAEISRRLGVDRRLPHINDNPLKAGHYTDYYSERTREAIRRKFAVDIEYFGYTFGD